MVDKFSVVLVDLDPTIGSEYNKTRPCVVVSPTDLNNVLGTVIIAPMTSVHRGWPFRPLVTGPKTKSELAIDQMRVIDKRRIRKTLGKLNSNDIEKVQSVIEDFFH
ncbi:type II toxin-antitoxin system PemK/MazF family toxin [Photobacterium damselae]|uniref:Type II toxin-antitoxin system PemK/MazF family toxin n=1 Tax=Photobacterium damselae subsp. damselae TaxID=85581 RepID=A0AAD3WVW7_PHODD|nr:type II toxin-antitoxin system PemK/MazF family toxin [Photobacterium damselae]KAB1181455.1 type II toxin-antitoxin system PemK/MazF family toxin [Photobacterium damselae subsp. damselae]PSB86709.1 type II toxin-antitoxin system PemK/MazF family toxin [Photobacterium damselae subsp. damselae]PSB88647.1 type II toxin-antitoxin system PemK/MazF family toxin [Photobacterium damselae subsp. damselae]QSH59312.1 type II toxin-antitoxin system PemK/MazF family toxin [Photobacterium damselae subsp. 